MSYWPQLLALVVGAGLTVQVGMNATVSRAIGSTLLASIVNFVVGLAALCALALMTAARPPTGSLATVPGWAWLGGLFGAAYVAASTMLAPRVGATALLALLVAGQLVSGLLMDHYGVLGFPEHPVSWQRIAGVLLLLAGVWLILRR
jgi:transporter family-2 protein